MAFSVKGKIKFWRGFARDGTRHDIEGDPSLESNFKGYVKKGRIRYASLLIGNELVFLRKIVATQVDTVICSGRCRKARTPICRCSCGGKNHGIDVRDIPGAVQENEVEWIGA